jgi:hypothetical protein
VTALESPWEQALGAAVEGLHPRLRAYFGPIPPDRVGRGSGTFDVVGTPNRLVWPILAVLGRAGIVFPVWQQQVPFTVENRFDGTTLRAHRVFAFRGGSRTMVDAVEERDGLIVDRLGCGGPVEAELAATVQDGMLLLRSVRVRWRGIPIPFGPRVHLSEAWNERTGRQHVAMTLQHPLLGMLYSYRGDFDYALEDA